MDLVNGRHTHGIPVVGTPFNLCVGGTPPSRHVLFRTGAPLTSTAATTAAVGGRPRQATVPKERSLGSTWVACASSNTTDALPGAPSGNHRRRSDRGTRCEPGRRRPGGSQGARRTRQGGLRLRRRRRTVVGARAWPIAGIRRVRRKPHDAGDRGERCARRRALADRERCSRGFRAADTLLAAWRADERQDVSAPLHRGVAPRDVPANRRRR